MPICDCDCCSRMTITNSVSLVFSFLGSTGWACVFLLVSGCDRRLHVQGTLPQRMARNKTMHYLFFFLPSTFSLPPLTFPFLCRWMTWIFTRASTEYICTRPSLWNHRCHLSQKRGDKISSPFGGCWLCNLIGNHRFRWLAGPPYLQGANY
ncbi:hypothetical protein V8C43DRAFT_285493 [Trichoderma afarasin]